MKQRIYRGVMDVPKSGESRQVAVSDGTWRLLEKWRRNVEPRLAEVGWGWASFQVLRRTNASLMKQAGVDSEMGADQSRHGLGVSLEVHRKSDLEKKQGAVKKLASTVQRRRPKARKTA